MHFDGFFIVWAVSVKRALGSNKISLDLYQIYLYLDLNFIDTYRIVSSPSVSHVIMLTVLNLQQLPWITLVVYHLPKKSGDFGCNVNGRINFVSSNGKFLRETGFLERWTKIPKQNFRMKKCAFHLLVLLVPGLLA